VEEFELLEETLDDELDREVLELEGEGRAEGRGRLEDKLLDGEGKIGGGEEAEMNGAGWGVIIVGDSPSICKFMALSKSTT